MALKELLAGNLVFRHLHEAALDELERLAVARRYQSGERITHYGDTWPYFFILEGGSVTALKESAEGRSLIVVTIRPGEVFWGLSFFQEETPMIVSLIADEPSVLHLWSREDLVPILKRDGQMTWSLAQLMLHRMLRASDIVEELAFQPTAGRLAGLLLDHFGDAVDEFVSRDLTLEEMAARIGTTRETVCRQLYSFMNKGAIQITRTDFRITDRDVLEDLAGVLKG